MFDTKNRTLRRCCVALALLLVLVTATSCTGGIGLPGGGSEAGGTDARQEQQAFDELIDSLPALLIGGDSLSLRYLYREPEKVGIEPLPPVLYAATQEDWDEMMAESRALYEELRGFDPELLSENSRLTREILLDLMERELVLEDFFLHFNNDLGSYLGTQAQIPLRLADYPILSAGDLEDYFHYMETIPAAFEQYFANEQLRQENDVGLSQDMIDLVIEQCENLITKDHDFLYEVTEEKIDDLEEMDDAEKAQAKERNRRLIDDCVLQAYQDLADALAGLDAPTENRGLAHLPGGKEYYEALMIYEVGVDMGPRRAAAFLEERLSYAIWDMLGAYQEIVDGWGDDVDMEEMTELAYVGLTEPEEVILYMIDAIVGDFPDAGEMLYKISPIPAAMEENYSPASYRSPPIDRQLEEPGSIRVNYSKYEDTQLYETIVHEAVPGHMYQIRYANNLDIPDARKIMQSTGFVEGWATYVEYRSHEYLPEEYRPFVAVENAWTRMTLLATARMDLGIHYEGWGVQEVKEYINETLMIEMEDENAEAMYLQLVETPANSMYYILTGEMISEMREQSEAALGSRFSLVEFHEAVLSVGCASIPMVQKQVDAWVAENAGSSGSGSSGRWSGAGQDEDEDQAA